MEQLQEISQIIALTLGASWASGINLYAAILVLGLGSLTGGVILPPDLQILSSPIVIAAAGLMYAVEFFADKIPGVDNGWDALHTFVRIPAGALLAWGAAGQLGEPLALAAALVGGAVAAGSHATKAGTRVLVNTSPEPFTNWGLSVGEDVAVLAGLWTAVNHPVIFMVLFALFVLFTIWVLPKIWRGVKKVFRFILGLFGHRGEPPVTPIGEGSPGTDEGREGLREGPGMGGDAYEAPLPAAHAGVPANGRTGAQIAAHGDDLERRLQKLKDLRQKGLIDQAEYEERKKNLLNLI